MFELFEILSIKRAYWGANKIHSLCSAMVTVIHIRNIALWVFCCVFRFTLTSIMDFDINLDRISQKCLGCDPVVTIDAVFVLGCSAVLGKFHLVVESISIQWNVNKTVRSFIFHNEQFQQMLSPSVTFIRTAVEFAEIIISNRCLASTCTKHHRTRPQSPFSTSWSRSLKLCTVNLHQLAIFLCDDEWPLFK